MFRSCSVGGSPTGAWQVVGSAADVAIDESRRPFLSHLRLLQEWLLCGCALAATVVERLRPSLA